MYVMNEKAVSCFSIVPIMGILAKSWCQYTNCSTQYREDNLIITIFVCYLWEMALNISFDVSFDNMHDWKVMREKAQKVNCTKVCIKIDEVSGWIITIDESVWKEVVVAWPSYCSEFCDNSQCSSRFEPTSSRIQVYNVTCRISCDTEAYC
jgi:hypothetical protein